MSTLDKLRELVEAAKQEQKVTDMLEQILRMSPQVLPLLMKLVGSMDENEYKLEEIESRQKKDQKDPEESTDLSFTFLLVGALINQIAQCHMPKNKLMNFINEQASIIKGASQLPKPFCDSPAVWGAIGLIFQTFRGRPHDYYGHAYRWTNRLGKPRLLTENLLRDFPGLIPVAFNSRVLISHPPLYYQYFGSLPALQRSGKSKGIETTLRNACKKWPLEDIYAFCPLPIWQADDRHKLLWFDGHTWQEQQEEMRRLERIYTPLTVRAATLQELMFLDWSMRLSTSESPMGIWSFHCEHPSSTKKLLLYGNISDHGGRIETEEIKRTASKYQSRVMPLFILPSEMTSV